MFLSFCWQRFPVWRSRVAECSVLHDKEIRGGRRSEDARDSGNMKEVREIWRGKVKDRFVEEGPVMMQAAELHLLDV